VSGIQLSIFVRTFPHGTSVSGSRAPTGSDRVVFSRGSTAQIEMQHASGPHIEERLHVFSTCRDNRIRRCTVSRSALIRAGHPETESQRIVHLVRWNACENGVLRNSPVKHDDCLSSSPRESRSLDQRRDRFGRLAVPSHGGLFLSHRVGSHGLGRATGAPITVGQARHHDGKRTPCSSADRANKAWRA